MDYHTGSYGARIWQGAKCCLNNKNNPCVDIFSEKETARKCTYRHKIISFQNLSFLKIRTSIDNTCYTCYTIIVRREEHERQRFAETPTTKWLGGKANTRKPPHNAKGKSNRGASSTWKRCSYRLTKFHTKENRAKISPSLCL